MRIYSFSTESFATPPSTYSATRYNTDDGRGNTGDMLVRDIAFYPSGWRFA